MKYILPFLILWEFIKFVLRPGREVDLKQPVIETTNEGRLIIHHFKEAAWVKRYITHPTDLELNTIFPRI